MTRLAVLLAAVALGCATSRPHVCVCEFPCEYETGRYEYTHGPANRDGMVMTVLRGDPIMATHPANWTFPDGRDACVDFCPCEAP